MGAASAYTYEDLQREHPCYGPHMGDTGRIHLPVSAGCNLGCRFCDRVMNDYEDRPGVTGRVITPEESLEVIRKSLELCPEIRVVGIAGPGDTLATNYALDTFRLVRKHFPQLIRCMSTNGLLLDERAEEVIEAGIDSLTVTVNAVDPEILAKINKFIIYHGKRYEGTEAAEILIQHQLAGIRKICEAGITVKINTVLVPDINGPHIETIARTVAELGAEIYNIIPLIPAHELKDHRPPTCQEISEANRVASRYMELFTHCQHCRADAIGIPGVRDITREVYGDRAVAGETFSHG